MILSLYVEGRHGVRVSKQASTRGEGSTGRSYTLIRVDLTLTETFWSKEDPVGGKGFRSDQKINESERQDRNLEKECKSV